MGSSRQFLEELFGAADIRINGDRPWDIRVDDERFYARVMRDGTLGLGESYMLRWWDTEDMDELTYKGFRARLDQNFKVGWKGLWHAFRARFFNLQRRERAEQVAEAHYNLSNEFYEYILGDTMAYTCAYWKDAESLDEAQRKKYDLVCRKLDLQPGDRVLEHGCGWGAFARYVAENHGCKVVAVNVSVPQVEYAQELCAGLPVEVHRCDYRDHQVYNPGGEPFDKVVSIGMAEHVGPDNYRTWFEVIHPQMKDEALFLLHTIGGDVSVDRNEAFTQKYIFPNCVIPSLRQLTTAAEGLFTVEDVHNFWKSYYYTLREWQRRFDRHWNEIEALDSRFDDRFYRMWNFYNFAGMGAARSRRNCLWQIVFSKVGSERLYETAR